jgi:hypothetical protein
LALGKSGIHLSLTANIMDKRVGVNVALASEKGERALTPQISHYPSARW